MSVLLAIYVAGVVALFASARLDLLQAGELLVVPAVGGTAVLRPEWVILILLAVPPAVLSPLPPRHATLIMVAALFGFLLQGRIRLGPETGIYPLVGIVALAIAFKANVPPAAAATADGVLKFIVYYMALMLVGFHTAAEGKIDVDRVVNALLVGLVAGGVLQAFATDYSGYDAITQTPFRGTFAYLAVMGFGVTYVRLSLRRSAGRQPVCRGLSAHVGLPVPHCHRLRPRRVDGRPVGLCACLDMDRQEDRSGSCPLSSSSLS